MTWTETKPGIWQRPIGENERFIKLIGDRGHQAGREHWSVTAGASFALNKTLTPTELSAKCREAWCRLRFEHPSIACTADDEEGKLTYHVASAESLAAWANESFSVHERSSVDDVIASFKPSQYTTAHLLPAVHAGNPQILIHSAHWRTDGFGALQLIDSFLDSLCKAIIYNNFPIPVLAWGQEPARLAPGIEEVLSLPIEPTPDIISAAQDYLKTVAHTRNAAGVSLTPGTESSLPAGTRSAALRLSPAVTSGIRSACDSNSISLLSAVHAACAALTLESCPPSAPARPYTSTIRLSLRPHLPEPYRNNPAYAAAIYTGGYMFPVPADTAFLEACKLYEAEYRRGVTPELLKSRREYAIQVFNNLQGQAASKANPSPPAPVQSEVDISSVGNAEELVKVSRTCGHVALGVDDVVIGVETLTRQTYCFVYEFQGRLGLRIVYNEAFYTHERVEGMVKRLGEILVSGLGLE
ncbi:hypothetical protein QBC42DRAFT_320034 [Cladorrhinum samala]|uniref:Uncharacterized protein n=1 Tax=Cladorrhinum samala TaxID=585594 RepID=A0AAV9HZI1_9PEZI|nr:hypothetical protein QBC42DRAFT_320034 [Cladorrhinum samala]